MALQNHWIVPYNGVHSLSFAALSSSLREGAEAAAPQREAMSLPYGVRGKPQATAINGGHSLREGAEAAAPQREAMSLPYGVRGKPQATATNGVHSLREGAEAAAPLAGGCEPPLRVR